jgi:hypothetical protein
VARIGAGAPGLELRRWLAEVEGSPSGDDETVRQCLRAVVPEYVVTP